MALTVKGTKALEATKPNVAITTYTSGAPVAPVAGSLAVYIDLATGNEHRAVEMTNKLQTLIDYAREVNYEKPTATVIYFRVPLDGSKHDIESTTTSTDIVAGDVAIGISATVRSGESGSILFDECFKRIIEVLFEQDFGVTSEVFVIRNIAGTVAEAGTLPITAATLRSASTIAEAADIDYTVTTGPANGQIEDTGDPGTPITTFTQADIDSGVIVYVHDGTETVTGAFEFSVSDGTNTLTGQDFAIVVTPVNDTPTVAVNTGVTVDNASTTAITALMLRATDVDDTDADLIFTITSGPLNGQIEDSGDPGTPITMFMQADLTAGTVQYVHDGSATITGDFEFSVSDGTAVLADQTFVITVNPA